MIFDLTLYQALLIFLLGYFTFFLLFGLIKGKKYLKTYSSGQDAKDIALNSINGRLSLTGLSVTALALFVGFQVQGNGNFSTIILFFSISFVVFALATDFARFPKKIYEYVGDVLEKTGFLSLVCGFLVFFNQTFSITSELTIVYLVLIVGIILFSLLDIYKFNRYWEILKGEKIDEKTLPKPIKKKKENDSKNWNETLEHLITIVDEHCKKKLIIPKFRNIFAIGTIITGFIVLAFLLYSFVIVGDIISIATATEITTVTDQVNVLLSFMAISLTIVTLEFSISTYLITFPKNTSKDLAEYYFKILSRQTIEMNKPYLKALINMKCKEIDTSLESVYQECLVTSSDVFSKEALLKSLYS